jgi:flagellin
MNAHRNASQTNAGLDKSLSSLSSGLRINVAADDASGMTIADSLRSQAQGLGQAINNANDGVAVVQTADGALDEYINIINTVRTKSIQAASDGQNADSRLAIQKDIDRLLEAADGIATQTQFNGQKLLDGTFTNKSFHIGAYAGETVSLSVDSTRTNSIGDVKYLASAQTREVTDTAKGNLASGMITETDNGYVLKADSMTVNGFDISASLNENSPTRLTDAKSIAQAITAETGMLAQATTVIKGGTIQAGQIDSTTSLEINGFAIADTTVLADDSDGALARAINDISSLTGVTATSSAEGLELTSIDGSNISIAGGGGPQVSTMNIEGVIEEGDYFKVQVDGNAAEYTALAGDTRADIALGLAASVNATAATSAIVNATVSGDSIILTALDATTDTNFIAVGTTSNNAVTDSQVFASSSTAEVAATAQVSTVEIISGTSTSSDAFSLTISGIVFAATAAADGSESASDVGDALVSLAMSNVGIASHYTVTNTAGVLTITSLDAGTSFVASAAVTADSDGDALAIAYTSTPSNPGVGEIMEFTLADLGKNLDIGDSFVLVTSAGAYTSTVDATTITTPEELIADLVDQVNADATSGFKAYVTDDNKFEVRETVGDGDPAAGFTVMKMVNIDGTGDSTQNISAITTNPSANADTGYTITGLSDKLTDVESTTTISNFGATDTATVTINKGELVLNGKDMAGIYGDGVNEGTAAADFIAAVQSISGMEDSTLLNGTLKLVVNDGQDLNISGVKATETYKLAEGVFNESATGKVDVYSTESVSIGGNNADAFGFVEGNHSTYDKGVSLESIDVTTRDAAERAIEITDSALLQLDATRSDLGSVQNQLESTIRNISVTQVNVTSAESQIRDVDFAQESAKFAKLNILAQSGSYAMSQANAVQQNVLRLLQ